MAEGWSWRDRDPSRHAGLRYEPGNWGDALKGEWALIAVEALLARGAVRVLDPFAGAPRYPLSPASAVSTNISNSVRAIPAASKGSASR